MDRKASFRDKTRHFYQKLSTGPAFYRLSCDNHGDSTPMTNDDFDLITSATFPWVISETFSSKLTYLKVAPLQALLNTMRLN